MYGNWHEHRLAMEFSAWPERAGGYLKQAWLQQTLHAEPQPTTRLPALLQDDPLFGGPRRRPSQPAAAGATGTVASTSTDPASDAVHERASGTEAASSAEAIERGAAERPEAAGVPGEVWMPRLQLQLLGLTPEALRSATTLVQPSAGGVGGPGAGPVPAREASAVGSGPQGARPLGPAPGLRFPAEMDGLLEAIDARFPLATSPESFLKNQAARYLLWAGRQAPPRPVIMSALGECVRPEASNARAQFRRIGSAAMRLSKQHRVHGPCPWLIDASHMTAGLHAS